MVVDLLRISPTTRKKFQRFRSIKRGYYSLLFLAFAIIASAFAELYVNSRALVVKYQGQYFFPTYGSPIPGEVFGLDYKYETNYRDLKELWKDDPDNYVIMPFIPYNPLENNYSNHRDAEGNKIYHPIAPSWEHRHFLGTDKAARDVLARLIFAFRNAMVFALLLTLCSVLIGMSVGCLMGYLGGIFDLFVLRLLEIFSALPFLFFVMILSTLVRMDIFVLFCVFVMFGWLGFVGETRSMTFREKAVDYVAAARALGASNRRIMFRHIIPNTFVVIIVALPFAVSGGITSLTGLDYLGFGLPPPTPSIGELITQGQEYFLQKPWILASVVTMLVMVLVMVTFIGESLREAFDPKRYTLYE